MKSSISWMEKVLQIFLSGIKTKVAAGSNVEAGSKEEEDHEDELTLSLSGDFDSSKENLAGASSSERGRNAQVSI